MSLCNIQKLFRVAIAKFYAKAELGHLNTQKAGNYDKKEKKVTDRHFL